MTETTATTFTGIVDFITRAQVGDIYDEPLAPGDRAVRRFTVQEVQEQTDRGRSLEVEELMTRHTGRPHYVYVTTRHVKTFSSDDPRFYTVDLNMGLPVVRVATTGQYPRFNARVLAREHAKHLA